MQYRQWLGLLSASFVVACASQGFASTNVAAPSAQQESSSAADSGPLRAKDILELRDIGGFSVSPDGRRIAYSVRQADVATNSYRFEWFIAPADRSTPPRRLPFDAGKPIPYPGYGAIMPEDPKWSADGERLALRRMSGDRIGLLVVSAETGEAIEAADGVARVDGFAWRPDGVLVYRTGLNIDRYHADVAKEARHGWLQDSRIRLSSPQRFAPEPPDCAEQPTGSSCEVRTLAFGTDGKKREATAEEVAFLGKALDAGQHVPTLRPRDISRMEISPWDGRLVWAEFAGVGNAKAYLPIERIVAQTPEPTPCLAKQCVSQYFRFSGFGWVENGTVWFIRSSGYGAEKTELYVWDPKSSTPRLVWSGKDKLGDCKAAGKRLVCLREQWTRPAHLVSIDLASGQFKTLVDPNSELAARAFPRIEQVPLKGVYGATGFAQLVYPADYRLGRRYPLVVVTYSSRGFLRGGTANEYPVFPLSSEGYFVLSVNVPEDEALMANLPADDYQAMLYKDEHERGEAVGAIEAAVQTQIDRGLVDREKVAITGLSYGAELVHHAMRTSSFFSVGIASGGQGDLTTLAMIPDRPMRAHVMKMYDETTLIARPGGVVARGAWSQHPECLRSPLLLNLKEYEMGAGPEGREVLAFEKRPIEVRTFPDEEHNIYHPQNLAGVYDNNLQWLAYWLKGEKDDRPELAAQYRRWDEMKARLLAEKASTPPPACR